MRLQRLTVISLLGLLTFTVGCGCNSRQQIYDSAPPIGSVPTPPINTAPPMGGVQGGGGAMPAQANGNGAYHWRDVPANENVPVVRATFDQGGYQIYAQSGEIIAVPFENQNLQVLKFGRSQNGMMSFVNENNASPLLYIPNGGYLENASAAGAKWNPLPNDIAYTRPVYVSLAPSWNAWTNMGWYPGMAMYGGMWGYNPGISLAWMPSFYVNIGGSRYNGWGGYSSYYNSNPGYTRNSVVYRNYNMARPTGNSSGFGTGRGMARSSSGYGNSGFGRRSSSSGFGGGSSSSGFGRSSSGFGSSRPSSGFGSSGFGSGNGRTFGGSGGSFSGGRPSSAFGGSGGGFSSSRPSFGSSGSSGGSSAFGRSSSGSFSGQRSTGSSFGTGRTSGGSFSGSGSGFGGSRQSGSSFGGSSSSGGGFRSGGSSFGSGGRSSFGGSSGRSSFGGSSSGRRR